MKAIQHKTINGGQSSASDGTLSSQSSSNWSLEQAMDYLLNVNSCTGSVRPYKAQHNDNAVQVDELAQTNVNNFSPDFQIKYALTENYSSTSKPLAAVDINRERNTSGAEVASRLENGDQIGNNLRVYQHCKENYIHGNSVGSVENYDAFIGLQNTQITNYADGDYRPQKQMYLNGTAHTEMLLSDLIRNGEHIQNTEMQFRGRADPMEFSYDQTLGTLKRLDLGRAIRGSATGLNTVPMTSSIKTEHASTENQSCSPKEYVRPSIFLETSTQLNAKPGTNMWVGANQDFSFEKCMPNIRCGSEADDNSPNIGDFGLRRREHNNYVMPEFVLSSNSGIDWHMSSTKTVNSIPSLGGNQGMLPTSAYNRKSDIKPPLYAFGSLRKNVDMGINNHISAFNPTPGGPVYFGETNNNVGHRDEMLRASPFWNI